jgi:hypothetical protein
MAYSGTTNQTKINVDQLVSYAFRDAGKTAEEITPEYVDAAKQALFYNLQNLSNLGVNLWLLEDFVIGAQTNQPWITLPPGTIDVREANWVYIVNPSITSALPISNPNSPALFNQTTNADLNLHATSTLNENWFGASYSPGTRIFYVGFNAYCPGTTATYNLDFEVSNDGITWNVWESFPATTLADREWAYFTINATQEFYYFRIKNRTTTATFSLRAIQFAQSQQVIPLARLNRDDYWNLPNKQFPSQRSLQYWYDRQIDPSMYLWPVPNNNYQVFQLIIEKEMQDVGTLTNEIYVPNRWITSVQASLSHKLSLQLPGVDVTRIQYLEGQADKLFMQANNEERDKSPIYFQPNISYYTR